MNGSSFATWMLLGTLVSAPPPAEPPPSRAPERSGAIDANLERESWIFAEAVADLAERVAGEYARDVAPETLLLAGLEELYQSSGLPLPDHFRDRAKSATSPDARRRVAQQARLALGRVDAAEGILATVLATDGFRKATDPYNGLMAVRGPTMASSDADFGIGFELAGARGSRWLAYQADLNVGEVRGATSGLVPCPVAFPWQITRVLPGSPAAQAGLRPGDHITHLNGDAISPRTNRILVNRLLAGHAKEITMTRDDGRPPRVVKIEKNEGETYLPESIFGVRRRSNGSWDFMLDPREKIAYIRVGTVETGADEIFREALNTIVQNSARGLILDLRWCPGGYVNPTTRIAGLLLPEGKLITRIGTRYPERQAQAEFTSEPIDGREEFVKLPLVVLIGPGTIGGGEMVVAALKHYQRGIIAGQRTFGKANVMTPIATRINGLAYKVSTGYALRPDGTNRHRFPDSKPKDPWGVRPDRGYEIPLTPMLAEQLQRSAELQAIRPSTDRTAVAFDDPLLDPQKLIAVRFLKEAIAKSAGMDR